MGSGSQYYFYLLRKEAPTEIEKIHHFTHINIDDRLKKIRRNYRKLLAEETSEDRQP